MTEQLEQVGDRPNQITKPKSEGRVASGKRLVEWNRKNKADLLKNRGQEPTGDQQEPASQASSQSSQASTVYYGAAALAAVVVVLYLSKRPTAPAVQQKADDTHDDVFTMN